MNDSTTIALTWCLAWGENKKPQFEIDKLDRIRKDIAKVDPEIQLLVTQVEKLQEINFPKTLDSPEISELWQQKTKIGLVYGGATKIKGYVFDSAKLPEIRGASAILDRINLVDLPAFFRGEESARFRECQQASEYCRHLRNKLSQEEDSASQLFKALIPELIIYSTGGNILAFCPAAFVDDLANLIEKQYSRETLTANSCAVGETFKLLEIRFGLLKDNIADTPWLNFYQQHKDNQIVKTYFKNKKITLDELKNKKSFNEIAGKLAIRFNQRRNGNDIYDRPSRRYPPMFETHPYLIRDTSDRALAVFKAAEDEAKKIKGLPNKPALSESLARKNYMGRKAKRESSNEWFEQKNLSCNEDSSQKHWDAGAVVSWVKKFENYLAKDKNSEKLAKYYQEVDPKSVKEAISLEEVGNSSKNFLAYIYADGNNMGGYIQGITTPQEYMEFSRDIFKATEKSVYRALAAHLHPQELKSLTKPEADNRNGKTVHPFEIITIGGDDVLLIVPANKALEIAQTIGVEFEGILSKKDKYKLKDSTAIAKSTNCHRYKGKNAEPSECILSSSECILSSSIGVLITSYNTPIYYADRLVEQLLKSAKKKAKSLKQDENYQYHGGTVDFLALKSVTMISSDLGAFREEGLQIDRGKDKLKLYAAPYTFYELAGLIDTTKALKRAEFPRSQMYQIREFLKRGKNTAMLNYRYFRTRLTPTENQELLQDNFENAWCKPKDENNKGNLAPWMSVIEENEKASYETIWREIIDIYPFIEVDDEHQANKASNRAVNSET